MIYSYLCLLDTTYEHFCRPPGVREPGIQEKNKGTFTKSMRKLDLILGKYQKHIFETLAPPLDPITILLGYGALSQELLN